jgi:hypothetical protein
VQLSVVVRDVSDSITSVVYSVSSVVVWDPILVFTATNQEPPFTTTVPSLLPGHYIVHAIATDSRGGAGHAFPVHFHVHEMPALMLQIELTGGQVRITWDDPAAELEASTALGPNASWGPVPGATSPFIIPAPTSPVFYRLHGH